MGQGLTRTRRRWGVCLALAVMATVASACHRSPDALRWDRDQLIADRHFAYKNDPDLAKRKRMLSVALQRYVDLIRRAPNDERRAGARFAVGETLLRLGRHQEAILWYWRMVNGELPRYRRAKALYRIAKIHLDYLKQPKTGHKLLERVLLNYPMNLYASHALKRRVLELMRGGVDVDVGIDYLMRLHKRLKHSPLADDCIYFAAKWAARSPGKGKLAESLYKRVIKEYPTTPFYDDAYWGLQRLQRSRGAYQEAIRTLMAFWNTRRSAWLFGTYETRIHPEAIFEVGQIYRVNLRQYRLAIKYFRLVRESYPTDKLRDDCLYYIGWSQLQLGQRSAALETFRRLKLEGTEFIRVSAKDPRTGLPKVFRWESRFLKKARRLMRKAGLGPL